MTTDTTTQAPAPAAGEEAADLAAIDAMAAELAPPAPQPAGQGASQVPATVPQDNLDAELGGLLLMASKMLAPMFPSLERIYTPEATQAAGVAIAGVCRKHGWLAGGMFGQYGEEVAAAAVLLPLGFATYQGVSADLAERRAKETPKPERQGLDLAAQPPQAVEVGTNTVSFGAPAAGEGASA